MFGMDAPFPPGFMEALGQLICRPAYLPCPKPGDEEGDADV